MAEVPVYNASMAQGGDPTKVDVNAQYAGFEYNYIYILACTFIVFLILPGIAFLYTYSRNGGPFIGTLENFGLRNVMVAPSPGSAVLPEIVFCLFQLLFCACTVMILAGGAFERGSILPSLIFSFLWATIVYCPLARWTWSSNGWLYIFGAIDFAGGGPVHIASGVSALAYAMVLGKRVHHGEPSLRKPHNTTLVFLGTVLIWTGWLGFNGGSSLNASMRAMVAVFNTNTAGCTGILGWVLVDMIKHRGKFSVVGACEGAIAGLDINDWLRIDEGMDVFKLHGVGGIMGAFLTGLFASESISALDGASLTGGAIDGNGVQVGKQLAEICAIAGYSFVVSCILLIILKYIPGMRLRVDEGSEKMGLDRAQFFDEQIGDWSIGEGISSPVLMAVSKEPSESKDEPIDKKTDV
ncbi:hypothetical protein BBP40_002126 [Aspergillus hancockii]|nr:hypothetical protein BBP40_002126 [Aspergillus hancockii]